MLTAIRVYLADLSGSAEDRTARREYAELMRLYASSASAPLWVDATNRPTRQAEDALAVLGEVGADGLDPGDYFCNELARRSSLLRQQSGALHDVAAFDVTLSGAMLRYSRHLHVGRVDPGSLGYRLNVPEEGHDFVVLLHAAIVNDRIRGMAAGLAPPLAQ